MEIWITLLGYFLAPITGVVSYFSGLRKSRNDFLHEMQKSINLLTTENRSLVAQIIETNREIVALRKENETLRFEIERMSKKIESLKANR